MKKQFMFMAMAAMLIASCSSDDVVSTNTGRAIDFRTSVGTRGTETTTDNIKEFYVTAIDANNANYFTDLKFEKETNSTFFVSTPLYYWPVGDLKFDAYSPSAPDLGATISISSTAKTMTGFSPATAIKNQKDFVTAYATGNRTNNESSGVKLTFAHQLSQIEIKALNTNTGYKYEIVGARIAMPVSKGNFNFADHTWTLTGTEKAKYDVNFADAPRILNGTAATMMIVADGNAMLLPQQLTAWDTKEDKTNTKKGAYLALKIRITTAAGAQVYPAKKGEYDWAAVAIGTNWEAGKKYVYTLDFSKGAGKVDPEKPTPTPDPDKPDPFNPGDDILGKPIKFTVEVTEWTPADQPDINM